MAVTEFYRVLLASTGFYLVLPSFRWLSTGFYQIYRVLMVFTGFYRVFFWPNFDGCYRVLPSFAGFDWVLPSFTEFQMGELSVSLDFTEFRWLAPDFTEFQEALLGFT